MQPRLVNIAFEFKTLELRVLLVNDAFGGDKQRLLESIPHIPLPHQVSKLTEALAPLVMKNRCFQLIHQIFVDFLLAPYDFIIIDLKVHFDYQMLVLSVGSKHAYLILIVLILSFNVAEFLIFESFIVFFEKLKNFTPL